MKLHNIPATPKLVKKGISNLDSLNTSGLYCIPVVVLINCYPELPYISAELFGMYLKESCFPGRFHHLRMLGRVPPQKIIALVFFLWLVKSSKNC